VQLGAKARMSLYARESLNSQKTELLWATAKDNF